LARCHSRSPRRWRELLGLSLRELWARYIAAICSAAFRSAAFRSAAPEEAPFLSESVGAMTRMMIGDHAIKRA
jgi:hypothetical protein